MESVVIIVSPLPSQSAALLLFYALRSKDVYILIYNVKQKAWLLLNIINAASYVQLFLAFWKY